MNKKILIGSMLVFTMLLLMPSIPAIQYKAIQEKQFDNQPKESYDMSIEDLLDDINNNYWKHPIINFLSIITAIRAFRGFFIMLFSLSNPFNPDEYPEVENHIYFIRGMWLFFTGAVLNSLLYILAKNMGWEFYSYLYDFLKEMGFEW